jgi:diadenosine tetraphosphate (Ap4A) HIT family hydrolase
MTFQKLIDFLENKMSMAHIYQPLLIRSLVDAGGSATIRNLANNFVLQDESQLVYYEDRIKKMPVKVLKNHKIIETDGDLIKLNIKKRLTLEQKAKIRKVCEAKLQEYIEKRGLSIWDYRLFDKDPIPDSLYYRVMKDGKQRCALCGATRDKRMLHVDHIIPRSKGGKTEYENLQVLCMKCNLAKGNKDDTDFRGLLESEYDPNCDFCYGKIKKRIVAENRSVVAIRDKYAVTDGHHLILPKRHVTDYFEMTQEERQDAEGLIRVLKKRLEGSNNKITGFNVGTNCGESAGQTKFHAHIHLIPRRDGDTPNPRGGVRGVIPDKMDY